MYQCNETGRLFEEPREVRDEFGEWEGVCPCCGETDYDEVFPCGMCGKYVPDDAWVGDSRTGCHLCDDCRKGAIVTLFETGAADLSEPEEIWLDDMLDGGGWEDLKKFYKEARHVKAVL